MCNSCQNKAAIRRGEGVRQLEAPNWLYLEMVGEYLLFSQSLRPVDCEIGAVGRHHAAVVESQVVADTRHDGLHVQLGTWKMRHLKQRNNTHKATLKLQDELILETHVSVAKKTRFRKQCCSTWDKVWWKLQRDKVFLEYFKLPGQYSTSFI